VLKGPPHRLPRSCRYAKLPAGCASTPAAVDSESTTEEPAVRELTLEEVQTILTEGVALARSKGFPSTVAVVDMGGNLRGVLRPEKGRIANPDIAIKKAWTAAALHRSIA